MEQKSIIARIIVEILGSPKEHVEETMNQVIEKLKTEKDIRLINRKTYKTEQQEQTKLWSTFSEVELQSSSLKRLMDICFDYMPSSLEIIEPAGMEIDLSDISAFLNDLLARVHKYDMVLKNLHAQNLTMQHDLQLIKEAAKQAAEKKSK